MAEIAPRGLPTFSSILTGDVLNHAAVPKPDPFQEEAMRRVGLETETNGSSVLLTLSSSRLVQAFGEKALSAEDGSKYERPGELEPSQVVCPYREVSEWQLTETRLTVADLRELLPNSSYYDPPDNDDDDESFYQHLRQDLGKGGLLQNERMLPDRAATEKVVLIRLDSQDCSSDNSEMIPAGDGIQRYASLKEHNLTRKSVQRQVSAEIGEFPQPLFFDLQSLSLDDILIACRAPFSRLNTDPVFEEGICLVVENPLYGLALIPQADGRVVVLTEHPQISDVLLSEFQEGPLTRKELQTFLQILEKKEVVLFKSLDVKSLWRNDLVSAVREIVLGSENSWYLKSSITSGGSNIFRLENVGGEIVLTTNSPDAIHTVTERLAAYLRAEQDLRNGGFRSMLAKGRVQFNAPTFNGILKRLLVDMNDAILEQEIARTKRKDDLVEFRVICQQVPGQETVEVTAAYTKVSKSRVAANVKLGGHGETLDQVLHDLCVEHLPGRDPHEWVRESKLAVLAAVSRFANHWKDSLKRRGVEKTDPHVRDFAVDLVPTIGDEGQLVTSLLEVQAPYGYDGLRACDPDAAGMVAACSGRIRASTLAQEYLSKLARGGFS